MKKIVLFELNEVPLRVIDTYVAHRPASNLARILERAAQYETRTDDQIQLDPWISWPTLHRGVIDREHGLLHLGQPHDHVDRHRPPVWTLLVRGGRSVGVFGSLHSAPMPADAEHDYAFYVPDYFAVGHESHPRALEPFQAFNVTMTRGSARNVSRSVPFAMVPAARSLVGAGLRPRTVLRGVTQIVDELRDGARKTRRRNYQAELMGDVFMNLLRRHRPDFATFYTNNVAAAMHRYWGALYPEESPNLAPAWKQRHADEIVVAMDSVDALLGQLAEFVDGTQEHVLLVASSMGQGAIPSEETHEFLTIADVERFMACMGVARADWELRPAMVPCVGVVVRESARASFAQKLATLTIDEHRMRKDPRPLMPMTFNETTGGFFSIYVQIDNYSGAGMVRVGEKRLALAAAGLGKMPHEDGVNCTAQHVPSGTLLTYGASVQPSRRRKTISTLDVAPTVLTALDVDVPSYMSGTPIPL